jgi:hypothetical protein
MSMLSPQNGEWSFDNLTQINALGFNIDPSKVIIYLYVSITNAYPASLNRETMALLLVLSYRIGVHRFLNDILIIKLELFVVYVFRQLRKNG